MWDFFKDEAGQGMVEYGLVIGLIALVVLGAVTLFGTSLEQFYTNADSEISEALGVSSG